MAMYGRIKTSPEMNRRNNKQDCDYVYFPFTNFFIFNAPVLQI
jgi:hypothetical protein